MMTTAQRENCLQRAQALAWPPVRVWLNSRTLQGQADWRVALGSRRMNDGDAKAIDQQLTTLEQENRP